MSITAREWPLLAATREKPAQPQRPSATKKEINFLKKDKKERQDQENLNHVGMKDGTTPARRQGKYGQGGGKKKLRPSA